MSDLYRIAIIKMQVQILQAAKKRLKDNLDNAVCIAISQVAHNNVNYNTMPYAWEATTLLKGRISKALGANTYVTQWLCKAKVRKLGVHVEANVNQMSDFTFNGKKLSSKQYRIMWVDHMIKEHKEVLSLLKAERSKAKA